MRDGIAVISDGGCTIRIAGGVWPWRQTFISEDVGNNQHCLLELSTSVPLMTVLQTMSFTDAEECVWETCFSFSSLFVLSLSLPVSLCAFLYALLRLQDFTSRRGHSLKIFASPPESFYFLFVFSNEVYILTPILFFVFSLNEEKKLFQNLSFGWNSSTCRVPAVISRNTPTNHLDFFGLLIFIWLTASVILFNIQKTEMQDVNSENKIVARLRSVSSHPNSLCDIQKLEMPFVTFTEWE